MNMYDYNALCEIANSINDEYTKNTFLETIRRYNDCLEELQRKDNNWNELKKFVENELNSNVDKEKSFSGYQCKIILDKIQELENGNK